MTTPTISSQRKYTWRPDLPDARDHIFHSITTPAASVPMLACLPAPKDQGNLGSCTANAGTSCIEAEHARLGGVVLPISRLFYYYQERKLEGTVRQDSGAQIRDGVKQAANVGYCREDLWPYKISKFKTAPSHASNADAAQHRITEYLRLSTVDEMMRCLTDGFPITFGFTVYESFESDEVARTGVVPMPGPGEKVLGGHAVVLGGYDDHTRARCRNSWGPSWGQAGNFTIPWAYLADRNLSDDFWTIRKG